MINTADGYARYDGRSRDEYRRGCYSCDNMETIRAHADLSQPNIKRLKQIYHRMMRGFKEIL